MNNFPSQEAWKNTVIVILFQVFSKDFHEPTFHTCVNVNLVCSLYATRSNTFFMIMITDSYRHNVIDMEIKIMSVQYHNYHANVIWLASWKHV